MVGLLRLSTAIIMICISLVIYVIDFVVLNIVKNDVLILDFFYFFKGRVNKLQFLFSFIISIIEEIAFRSWLLKTDEKIWVCVALSSICFGIAHVFFSKYDIISKTILGIILAIIYVKSGNILYSVIVHVTYNYFAIKHKN